jgi:hypothetical protein
MQKIAYSIFMMKSRKISGAIILLCAVVIGKGFASDELKNVVSGETGYGYIVTDTELFPASPHGLLTTFYYGYILHDKPKSMSVLSLVLGYNLFPDGAASEGLHSMVYGLEYSHFFFTHKTISLLVDYGLQFNLILQSGREGYSFGHHTKLGLGGVWNVSERHKLSLNGAYNFITSPYFELSSRKFSYPSVTLRYHFLY